MNKSFRVASLSAAALAVAASAWAGQPAKDPALAQPWKDAKLQWGPCPPFMPKGCGLTVLHGDPSKPNLDVFFKVEGGSAIPAHTHTSAERMVLVSGKLDVRYEGQEKVTLKAGDYAYGPAGRPHEGQCHKGEPCVLFIAFESPLDANEYTQAVK